MPTNIKFLEKREVAVGTMAFYFAKPDGFSFKAGQNMDLTLINPAEMDPEGPKRTFSFITAPHEENLGFATRMRETAFKRTLKKFEPGMEISMEGPFGDMSLHNDSAKPAVFLAGGIGITPFFSMIKHAAKEKLPHKIFLFYSNRKPEDAAFLKELKDLQNQNPSFKLIATMTDADIPGWDGEKGYVTKEMVLKYVPNLLSAIGYLAGPATMVGAMRKLLNEAGLNDDYIRSEEFVGY